MIILSFNVLLDRCLLQQQLVQLQFFLFSKVFPLLWRLVPGVYNHVTYLRDLTDIYLFSISSTIASKFCKKTKHVFTLHRIEFHDTLEERQFKNYRYFTEKYQDVFNDHYVTECNKFSPPTQNQFISCQQRVISGFTQLHSGSHDGWS